MRNLMEHPITHEEMVSCLHDLSMQLAKEEALGDMRPLLLRKAAERLGALQTALVGAKKVIAEYHHSRL